MIRKTLEINVVLGLVLAVGCQSGNDLELASSIHQVDVTCSESSRNLLAGQHIDVGSVTVRQVAEYDDNTGDLVAQQVCVIFDIDVADWFITETHIAITDDVANLPKNRGGLKPGQFPYKNEGLHTTSHEHCVDYAAAGYTPGTSLYVAAHAVVQREDASGAVVQEETGWGEGHDSGGKNWSMYFEHDLTECAPPEPPTPPAVCGWRTQNRDDWGANACFVDNNALGCMRDNLWATAIGIYPEQHFEIGCYDPAVNKRTYRIDNKKTVQFHLGELPRSGIGNDAARPVTHAESTQYWLSGPYDSARIYTKLFGDVVALHMNVDYDRADGFRYHETSHDLADLVVGDTTSPCLGMTVAEILEEANTILGADIKPDICTSDYTAEELSECVNAINDAFRGGQDSNGDPLCSDYLTTPAP